MKFSAASLGLVFLFGMLFLVPRQSWAAQTPAAPASAQSAAAGTQQAYTLPPDKLAKAEALGHIRNVMLLIGRIWGLAVLWLLLQTRLAARLDAWLGGRKSPRWVQGLQYFAILMALMVLADLPLGIYAQSVSLQYGISVQSWGSWLLDAAKSLALTLGLGAPLMLLFHVIVRRAPRRYWLLGWAAAVVLSIMGAYAEPFFEPIFNKFEPLSNSDPALVARLEKVVERTGTAIPPERMYLMKASEKTNGLNAYVSGLGPTKRVVVWDTTAGRIPDDEVLFIFGHESGHYVLNHIPKGVALSAVGLLLGFWLCVRVAEWLARRRSAAWLPPADGEPLLASRTGLMVLLLVFSVGSTVTEPISSAVSRHFEHEADIYGQEAIRGLVADPQKSAVEGFNALGAAWLEEPNPNPFVVFWSYDHPSIQQRATFAAQYDPWKNGGRGEFFAK